MLLLICTSGRSVLARFPIADGEKDPNKLPLEPMLPDRLELEKLLEGPLNDMVRIRGACETRSVVLPAAGSSVRGGGFGSSYI